MICIGSSPSNALSGAFGSKGTVPFMEKIYIEIQNQQCCHKQCTPGHNNKIIVYNLPWELVPLDIFNKYREVLSSWEAFLGWKQSEGDAPHMPVSSSQSTNDMEL